MVVVESGGGVVVVVVSGGGVVVESVTGEVASSPVGVVVEPASLAASEVGGSPPSTV